MRRHPVRFPILFALVAVFGLLLATPAQAVAAKFHSTSSSVTNSGALSVSFDERGLGGGDINYTLTADAEAVFACLNGGGKNPSAANKRTVNDEVSAGGTFASRNGRVSATLTAGPAGAGSFACPNGQRLVLASISYTHIVLTDTTNGTSVTVANASRTFFTV
jgi:hypothetical protein